MYQLTALHHFPDSSFSSEVDFRSTSRLSHQISNQAVNANRGQEIIKNWRNQIVAAIDLMRYTEKIIIFSLDLIWR